jgi:hypothetical protein
MPDSARQEGSATTYGLINSQPRDETNHPIEFNRPLQNEKDIRGTPENPIMTTLAHTMPNMRAIFGDVISRLLDGDMKDTKNSNGRTYIEQLARDMFRDPKKAAELTATARSSAVIASIERPNALNARKQAIVDRAENITHGERFWTDLPYCLHRLEDGSWLPLNRSYKPLGGDPCGYYDYEACTGQAWRFRADPHWFGLS